MIRRQAARLWTAREGSAAVEFAMVAPLLIVLMFGVVMLGQAFFAISSVQWAVEKATRDLMIDPDVTGPQLEAKVAATLAELTDLDVEIAFVNDTTGTFPVTHVSTSIQYPVVLPLVPAFDLNYTIETFVPRPYRVGS